MKKEEMVKELDEVLGKANIKLVNICGDKKNLEDVVLTVEHGADAEIVRSGMNIVETIPNADVFKALKATKRAMWSVVDRTRDEVCGKSSEKQEKSEKSEKSEKGKFDGKMIVGKAFDDLMGHINDLIIMANAKLEEMTSGKFPYSFDDVIMTVDSDNAGVYVYSGRTPVCSVVRMGSKESLLRKIKSAVWSEVDATRSAIERRQNLKTEADALSEESKKHDKAVEALVAAGLDASIIGGCDAEAAKQIVEAVQKSVKIANRGLRLQFGGALDAIAGSQKSAKLIVKGFSGGFIIVADDKPCMVSRFPKIGNNKVVSKTIAFIEADVQAVCESRMRYLRTIQQRIDREIEIREKSDEMNSCIGGLQLLSAGM